MKNLNEIELAVLKAVLKSEYQNSTGEDCIDKPVWSFSISYNVEGVKISDKQVSGYVSSLSKKGYVGCDNGNGDDNCVWITKEGYEYIISKS